MRPDITGLVAYLFTCSLIIAIGEAMRAARAREAESHEVLRVTLRSIGDAVITTDVAGRVSYLNTVAESVTGWSHEDAVGRPLETVFRIVNETTRRPSRIRRNEHCAKESSWGSRTTPC